MRASEYPKFLGTGWTWFLRVMTMVYLFVFMDSFPELSNSYRLEGAVLLISLLLLCGVVDGSPYLAAWLARRTANQTAKSKPIYDPYSYLKEPAFSQVTHHFYHKKLHQYKESGYVYIIKDASVSGYFKIGRTINPARRIGRFEVVLPFTIHIISIIPYDDEVLLKSTLHRRYADKRTEGEWFDLSSHELFIILQMDINFVSGKLFIPQQ